MGKVELNNKLSKLWCMKKATMPLFSFITLTGISFTWNALFGSNVSNLFNVWFKDVYLNWKLGLSSFDILPL